MKNHPWNRALRIFLAAAMLLVSLAAWHFSVAAGPASGAEGGDGIPILMYHKVNPDPEAGSLGLRVTPADFDRQMRYLYEQGYSTVSLEDARDFLAGEKNLPPKPVVITFDDGYRDNYTRALPILEKYHFKATFFVVVNTIGGVNSFDRGIQPVNQMAGWPELRDMAVRGMEIGSHTLSHPRLAECSPEEAAKQIKESKLALESGLGLPVRYFSYPHGNFNAAVKKVVKECGYTAATTTRAGLNTPGGDPFDLKRIYVTGQMSQKRFVRAVTGGLKKEYDVTDWSDVL